MLLEDHAKELAEEVYEMVEDSEKAVKAASEIIFTLISRISNAEKEKILYDGNALYELGDIFLKWGAYDNKEGMTECMLAYLTAKNFKCRTDAAIIYEKNKADYREWIGNEIIKPVGIAPDEFEGLHYADSILLTDPGNKELLNSFLKNYKNIYRAVDDDITAWKKSFIMSASFGVEDIACLFYYLYRNRDALLNKSGCCAIEGVGISELLDEIVMNRARMNVEIYIRLIQAGAVELAAWMKNGKYIKNKESFALALADQIMLETGTWDIIDKRKANEKAISKAAGWYQDPDVVKELLSRLADVSAGYRSLMKQAACTWLCRQ